VLYAFIALQLVAPFEFEPCTTSLSAYRRPYAKSSGWAFMLESADCDKRNGCYPTG